MPRLKSKDLARLADWEKIRRAARFNVVFFRGRDSREDHGVVRRGSLYEVVEVLTLQAARELVATRGADGYGRRGLVRAIVYPPGADTSSPDGAIGVHVDDNFVE